MLKLIKEFPINFEYDSDYLTITAYSYAFFLVVFRVLAPYFSAKLTKSYDRLTCNQKVEWNSRVTSTLFSSFVSFTCLYILFIDDALSTSPVIYDSTIVKTNIAVVIGYVLADMTIILVNYRAIGDIFTVFHHCLSLFGYINALNYSAMPYFANFRLMVELSTPLVNMRWFLYACGYPKDSLHFFVNGITMTLVFFVVRILSIPIYWYKCYTILDTPQWFKLRNLRQAMVITCLALDIINIYWFRKMYRGALIVWSANWSYYEKHHKPQQLEKLHSYQQSLKSKTLLAVNSLTMIINNPGRYIGLRFVERLMETLREVRESFNYENEESEVESDSESEMNTSSPVRIVRLLPKPFKTSS